MQGRIHRIEKAPHLLVRAGAGFREAYRKHAAQAGKEAREEADARLLRIEARR